MAGDRYMQTYYGISAEQAARTGYPVYEPKAGLRDLALYANLRHDIGHEWTVLAGANTTRLLGPAANSPLTGKKTNWGLSAGAAWRF
jgi:outer membrane scaffolding protein for murein synthesis (MipA/OmpV family)